MFAYTFDHPLVVEVLLAARGRGLKVRIYADNTRIQASRNESAALQRLECYGVEIRSVRPKGGDLHAKLLVADSRLLLGSMNFTTNSQRNEERNVEIALSRKGLTAVSEDVHRLASLSKPLESGSGLRSGHDPEFHLWMRASRGM